MTHASKYIYIKVSLYYISSGNFYNPMKYRELRRAYLINIFSESTCTDLDAT